MTSPQTSADRDSEPEEELSRITILIGEQLLDIGVSAGVSISAVVSDVIEMAGVQLAGTDVEFDNTDGRWTFARLTGEVIDARSSLGEAGVRDGDILVIQEVDGPAASVLVDHLDGAREAKGSIDRWIDQHGWPATWFGLGVTLCAVASLVPLTSRAEPAVRSIPVTAVTTLLVGICCAVVACATSLRPARRGVSDGFAFLSLPLIFGGALSVLPGAHGFPSLPMALAVVGLAALIQLLATGRAAALHTTVIVLALLGGPAVLAQVALDPHPRVVGSILAAVAVMTVYLAPRATILLSRLPVPRVPTAGEPLDDIETQGGTAVEGVGAVGKQVIPTEAGMADRVRRARGYLTGTVAGAAVLAVVGCYFALDVSEGLPWQGTTFVVVVAAALCLRGRSHHDFAQSGVLIGGGLVIGLVLIVETATLAVGWQVNAAVVLVVFMVMTLACGLVAPRVDFSPVMRRWVELGEYLAIGLMFPLLGSIISLYSFFRELRI
ncbi:hypothetical protein MARA_01780 (plasmid) [Mycolicibacterium arabiense]|uniref:EccD-like transmembrane domain-containing protein n=1 Tax=Mycolicibacterium arabiense TaxID=1286181 RepID=A0A7I7RQ93_9MYCO|nr:type VII secretion integral membrane protein EccD [Mycolicibacterium arabiense]MCV7376937.1 type VII secretion integral membrane protein EccD [Mycolicibacterium arabiense]BBY46748.1 hypothetical protein MARA_01780 [Mycolicibacterium arabiense]